MKKATANLRVTFHPYKEENLTPVTLREEIRDNYLRKSIEWLLNYEQPNRLIRAEENESPWQAAFSTLLFIEAKKIFQAAGSHQNLIKEIDRKILGDSSFQGIAHWFIEIAETKDDFLFWDGTLYDTSIVTRALLSIRKSYKLSRDLEKELKVASRRAVGWLCERIMHRHQVPDYASSSVNVVLAALLFADQHFNKEFRRTFRDCSKHVGKNVFILLGDAIMQNRRDEIKRKVPIRMAAFSLCAMFEYQPRGVDNRAQLLDMLSKEVLFLEEISDSWGDPANKASGLASYLRITNLLDQIHQPVKKDNPPGSLANSAIVLSKLLDLTQEGDWFPDGSIYHSLYATLYVTRCFVEISQRWQDAVRPIFELFGTVVISSTEGSKVSKERKKLLVLEGDYGILKYRLEKQFQQEAWYHVGAILLLATVLTGLGTILLGTSYGYQTDIFWSAFPFVVTTIFGIGITLSHWVWKRKQLTIEEEHER